MLTEKIYMFEETLNYLVNSLCEACFTDRQTVNET